MKPGGVFCVRSMTKPLIGAATWMLVEDGRLKLGDRVAKYLPAFEGEGLRDVTIEQLLHHESGLPLSLIMADDPRKLTSVRAVADRAKGRALDFAPGTAFQYSDQGTDTLTAVIEVVTGAPAEDFVRARLLEPLGMTSTTCLLTEDHPLRARTSSAYIGSPRAWTRFSQRVTFSDYRDVGGAMLPWHTKTELAHPLIGAFESVVEAVELGCETPAGLFELRD